LAEFVALSLSKRINSRSVQERCLNTSIASSSRPSIALVPSNSSEPVTQTRGPELNPQKFIMLFARFVDFVKILSAPEICFLMIVIHKTNYGALTEVPIPRSDIIQNQAIPSLAVKQIREKLAAMGLIVVSQKRIGRGSEAWLYSLCSHKLNSMLTGKETKNC